MRKCVWIQWQWIPYKLSKMVGFNSGIEMSNNGKYCPMHCLGYSRNKDRHGVKVNVSFRLFSIVACPFFIANRK